MPVHLKSGVAAVLAVFAYIQLGNEGFAYTESILYSFCTQPQCTDGAGPISALTIDGSGNLFGTTYQGGKTNKGTVFELVANSTRTQWSYKVLYSFCPKAGCSDGANPESALVRDSSGNLYGVTIIGGRANQGVAYKLTAPTGTSAWKYTVLYRFCSKGGTACADGKSPTILTYQGATAGKVYDGSAPLFGTTERGGIHGSRATYGGTVFRLRPKAPRNREQVVHSFNNNNNGTDGDRPSGGLVLNAAGHIYGTTYQGAGTGQSGSGTGTVFELVPHGARGWSETILFSFDNSDGAAAYPASTLTLNPLNGALFGTTVEGGVSSAGAIFKVLPAGVSSTESTVYRFCQKPNCADGTQTMFGGGGPQLVLDSSGNLFGTTDAGGSSNACSSGCGIAFELGGRSLQVLYNFCNQANCADGAKPGAGLAKDSAGRFFGTTRWGGAHGSATTGGTVFELAP